jgi:predicted transcriptional regulator
MKTSVVRIPDDVLQRIDEVSSKQGVTRSELLVRTLRLYVGCLDIDATTGLPVSDSNGSGVTL